ncbi:MAG: hypothetical protein KGZ53_00585 [Peptococcaceae bacterium]|nr:hypothetical protein [Peptococcaceae bacterium]
MLLELVKRNGSNLLKAGAFLLLSNLASQALRDVTKDTMDDMARDIRRVKRDFWDRTAAAKQRQEAAV